MDPTELWEATLQHLEVRMTRTTFATWMKPTSAVAYEGGTLVVSAPDAHTKEELESRLMPVIGRAPAAITHRPVELRVTIRQSLARADASSIGLPGSSAPIEPYQHSGQQTADADGLALQQMKRSSPQHRPRSIIRVAADSRRSTPMFNRKFSFDTFVVGHGNRLAHAAAQAVAEAPASAYNPLFIYGGVGLGKTHLLHAVGQRCQDLGHSVLYVSSETFTNDLINSIRRQSTEQFRERYRHTDVLLVDDVQFIAGKESTQEEFFHTFNTLYQAHKQIMLSSDRSPKAFITLEERLRSRFEWGLTADIKPPDLETRIAILRFKAERRGVRIPGEVLEFIARQIHSNIRELEGALNQVVAAGSLMSQPVTVDTAGQMLRDFVPPPSGLDRRRGDGDGSSLLRHGPRGSQWPATDQGDRPGQTCGHVHRPGTD